MPYRWTNPVYYNYGSGGTVYYEGDTVVYNQQPAIPATEYYSQVTEQVAQVPEYDEQAAQQLEWLPLGVFAVLPDDSEDYSMMLQLAITRDGIIGGTYYNDVTGDSHPIEGTVDQETQRAAWRFSDGTNPDLVMETGIYNLVEEQTTALVHFGPDRHETWTLVRLQEPDVSETSGTQDNQ